MARRHFPNGDAATKLLYLILNRSEKQWEMPPRAWAMAKAQFAVIFGERFIAAMATICYQRNGAAQRTRSNAIEREWGSIESYLEIELGIGPDQCTNLREHLLAPN